MNAALTLFVFAPIVMLVCVGYFRPATTRTSNFRFARSMMGVALFFYATTTVTSPFASSSDEMLGFWLVVQSLAWVFVIVSFRGVFEVLAGKASLRGEQQKPPGA